MPNPVNRGSNKPAQRKGSQVTSRVARKWIGLADAGEWGRAWLPAQAPGRSRTMGGCEQLFSASVASPLSKTVSIFSRTITPLSDTTEFVFESVESSVSECFCIWGGESRATCSLQHLCGCVARTCGSYTALACCFFVALALLRSLLARSTRSPVPGRNLLSFYCKPLSVVLRY